MKDLYLILSMERYINLRLIFIRIGETGWDELDSVGFVEVKIGEDDA